MRRVCACAACLLALAMAWPAPAQGPDIVAPEAIAPRFDNSSFAPDAAQLEPPVPTAPLAPEFVDPGVPYVKSQAGSGPYLDLDEYQLDESATGRPPAPDPWEWQSLPVGLIYSPYLADTKASRFSTSFVNLDGDGWLWEPTLGAQVGLLRYGNTSIVLPEGFQIDAEGSAQGRLDMDENIDLRSVDFRGGIPVTWGSGRQRWKVGYYHLSSHLGDEFLLKNPNFPRLNFVRDVLIFGYAYYWTPKLRTYAEVGWGFHADVSEPWEVQFGLDYAPCAPTGPRGAPFFALNVHLREELDYSGPFTCQFGWAWRSGYNTSLLRMGGHYYTGKSNQYSFFNEYEQQLGLGIWYDF